MTAGVGWLRTLGVADSARVTHGAPTSRPQPNASNPAGTARAPFQTGEPMLSFIPSREGVEALPYGASGDVSAYKRRRPVSGGRGVGVG